MIEKYIHRFDDFYKIDEAPTHELYYTIVGSFYYVCGIFLFLWCIYNAVK